MSTGQYIAATRITQAKELLRDTDEPAAAIVHAMGYRHAPSFATAFRRTCGVSPTDWRRTAREVSCTPVPPRTSR